MRSNIVEIIIAVVLVIISAAVSQIIDNKEVAKIVLYISPAIIIAIMLLNNHVKKNNDSNVPSIHRETGTDVDGKAFDYLQILPANIDDNLKIIGRPLLFKKMSLLGYIEYTDTNITMRYETKDTVRNTHKILLEDFKDLRKGKYVLKVKINLKPYLLKYKFDAPLRIKGL